MHNQIGVTPDRTGEVQVIGLGQAVMSERLSGVTRALQTFQKPDFQRLFFRLAANRSEKSLDFFSVRKIADLVAKAENEFAILAELFRIGIFMHSVNRWDRVLAQLARNSFVGRKHEFLNQLVRFVVLNALKPNWFAVLIDKNFHFRKIEIERSVLEPFSTEQ